MTHPDYRKNLTLFTSFYGDNFDADIYTNGGTYHTVFVSSVDDGSSKEHKFHSRAKALAFAEGATS